MTARPEVAVIGAGVLGLSTAMHAARAGARVTIVERASIGAGSSGLSAGIVGTHYALPVDVALRAESLETFRELGEEIGFTATGVLRVGADDAEMAAYEASAALQRDAGVDQVEILDRDGLAALVPEMRVDDLVGGIWMAGSGHVDGHLLCVALLERAQASGARLLTRSELRAATRRDGRWRLSTSSGDLEADVVVNAAGPWSMRVGEMLGRAVEIVPQRHEMAVAKLARPRDPLMPNVGVYFAGPDGVVGDGLYWRAEAPDRLLVSVHTGFDPSDAGEDPDTWSPAVRGQVIELLAEKLHTRLPGLSDMGLDKGWAGLYPMTRDDQVSLGPWPDEPTLVDACGAGGFGIQIAPAAGRLAAAWACGDEPTEPWAAELLPERRVPAGA